MDKDKKYYEFVECLKTEIENFTKEWKTEVKVWPIGQEGEAEDLLCVDIPTNEGKGIQRFHVEKMYQDLINNKVNLENILDNVRDVLGTCLGVAMTGILDDVECYEQISKHLILRPLNYAYNKEKLNDGVYYLIGDVALVLYINIGNIEVSYASCIVRKEYLSTWEKSESEIMEVAIQNTYRLFPPRVFKTFSSLYLGQPELYEFMNTIPDILKTNLAKYTFLTTENIVNGAIAIFIPGVAKRLAELFGNDLYIGFINIDAAVIHDRRFVTIEAIRDGLRRCENNTENELSGKVYYYCRERDRIEVIC